MNLLHLITVILAAFAIVLIAFRIIGHLNKKSHAQACEAGLRAHRNSPFSLEANAGRISGQIHMYKIQWINVSDDKGKVINTYTSLKHLYDAEDVDPAEVRELDLIDLALNNIREYKDNLEVKPKGYIEHVHPKYGSIIQYTPGIKILGDTNRVGITVLQHESGEMYIDQIHISVNLSQHLSHTFVISTKEGKEQFEYEYQNDPAMSAQYAKEFLRYQGVIEEIAYFNLHFHSLQFNTKTKTLEYRSVPSTEEDSRDKFKGAMVV